MVADPVYLLDSNTGIYLLDGSSPAAAARLSRCERGSVVTSSICLGEMLVKQTALSPGGLAALLQAIAVLPFDEAAARVYGELPFKRRGFDRLIGAHALSLGLIVVTANEQDFDDIPQLIVENWTRP